MEALKARITPVTPDRLRMRNRHIELVRVIASLPAGLPAGIREPNLVYMSDLALSKGWVMRMHPDGSLYLHHSRKSTVIEYPAYEAVFDSVVSEATDCMEALWLEFEQLPLDSRPYRSNCELFLRVDPKSRMVLYYFVEYSQRYIFWVQEHVLETPFHTYSQLANILQSQFWNHVERFPAHRRLPPGAHDELHDILMFQIISVTTNNLSTAPYHPSDAALFVRSLENARHSPTGIDGAFNASVARLWGEQCRVRSHSLHGAPEVRLQRTEHRAPEPPQCWSELIGLLLLFNAPHSFYLSLKEVFIDELSTMYDCFWKTLYHDTLREEWKDHAFMATVCLAANMAFLAVGNVSGGNGSEALSPRSQVLSLCSTIFSIGAIVLSKSLPNFHRRLQRHSADDWMTSFSNGHKDGLYKLAMLFSLPFALFMWSLALFVAALFSLAFERWAWNTGLPVALVSGVMLGVLLISLRFLRSNAGEEPGASRLWARCAASVGRIPRRLCAGLQRLGMPNRDHAVCMNLERIFERAAVDAGEPATRRTSGSATQPSTSAVAAAVGALCPWRLRLGLTTRFRKRGESTVRVVGGEHALPLPPGDELV